MNLLNLLAGLAPDAAIPTKTLPDGTSESEVEITAPAKKKPALAPPSNLEPPATRPDIAALPMKPVEPGTYPGRLNGEGANTRYNNVAEANALQDVAQHYSRDPHGNGSGLINTFGAKGTLRNVLGTLGDAFLVQAGKSPVYAAQRYREQVADASAGFENDPASAASRIASTGAPGSMDDAQKMYTAYQQEQLRKATLQSNQDYRNATLEDRKATHDAQTADRTQQRLQRMTPYLGAIVGNSKDKASYAKNVDRAVAMAQRVDPSVTPADLGFVDAEDWEPNAAKSTGMTQGQVVRAENSDASLQQRGELGRARLAVSAANNRRSTGASVANSQRAQAGANARSDVLMLNGLQNKQNSGQKLTPAEQARWDKAVHVGTGKSGGGLNIPGLGKPGSPSGQPKPSQTIINRQTGARKGLVNGKWIDL